MSESLNLDTIPSPGEPFAFQFRGTSYELPPQILWPVSAIEHISNGEIIAGLADLLGEEAATRLLDDGITVGHLSALFEAATKSKPKRPWWRR